MRATLAKCYGGDISREAQAAREAEGGQEAHEGHRLVDVPQEAFMAILKVDD